MCQKEDPDYVTVLMFVRIIESARVKTDQIFLNLDNAVHIYLFTNQFLLFFELNSLWVPPITEHTDRTASGASNNWAHPTRSLVINHVHLNKLNSFIMSMPIKNKCNSSKNKGPLK